MVVEEEGVGGGEESEWWCWWRTREEILRIAIESIAGDHYLHSLSAPVSTNGASAPHVPLKSLSLKNVRLLEYYQNLT